MRANPSPMSVADYCHAFNQGKIKVNDEYQRNVGLWTSQARSFFIESILLEFPIPKIYLHAKLDLKSRQQVKEVVDGQQRTHALLSFFNNKQKLTNNIDTPELRGLKYSQLDPDWQSKFLSYSLPIDQFAGAPDDEVQEAFRRMNANNVPLNDEEQRNARFQGPFKWFIVQIADQYKNSLRAIGLFSRRDIVRMSDLKTYAEIVLAFDEGFSTVKGKQLDDLYKRYNGTFSREDQYGPAVTRAIESFLDTPDLHRAPFLRAHVFQSIVLALYARADVFGLSASAEAADPALFSRAREIKAPLSVLCAALQEPEAYPALQEFIDASTKKTNVEVSKRTRFAYFREALAQDE